MGFISLLLVFNIYSSVHDSTNPRVSEAENELVHQELIFELDGIINKTCEFCSKVETLRSLTCKNDTFVLVIGVLSSGSESQASEKDADSDSRGKETYLIRVTAEMKSTPLLVESLSRMMVETVTEFPPETGLGESCTIQLKQGREYLVTGSIDTNSLVPKLSPCDYILDWSSLQTINKHRIFSAFNSLKCS